MPSNETRSLPVLTLALVDLGCPKIGTLLQDDRPSIHDMRGKDFHERPRVAVVGSPGTRKPPPRLGGKFPQSLSLGDNRSFVDQGGFFRVDIKCTKEYYG